MVNSGVNKGTCRRVSSKAAGNRIGEMNLVPGRTTAGSRAKKAPRTRQTVNAAISARLRKISRETMRVHVRMLALTDRRVARARIRCQTSGRNPDRTSPSRVGKAGTQSKGPVKERGSRSNREVRPRQAVRSDSQAVSNRGWSFPKDSA